MTKTTMKKMKNNLCRRAAAYAGASLSLAVLLSANARAEEYVFPGASGAEFYRGTSYEDVYGAAYLYGGRNAADYAFPALLYGTGSNTSIGSQEKVRLPGQTLTYTESGADYGVQTQQLNTLDAGQAQITITSGQTTAYTDAGSMVLSDGSIGTVTIPVLGITYKVWEGESNESMAKGFAHYSSTSGWDGNVGLCGHNRGAQYTIGGIRTLNPGDTITYETAHGVRVYEVTSVDIISNMDWSRLQATEDNRLTLTTCLENQPDYRVCVQATEKVLSV